MRRCTSKSNALLPPLRHIPTRSITRLALLALAVTGIVRPALSQSGWTATLFIDPFPSPYLSDWEINPNISTLTLINGTGQPQTATAVYRVMNRAGQILASGRSDPQTVPPDEPRIYTSFVDIAGTSSHDAATETQMVRTGRLPEGTYRACITIADGNYFVVGEACADFTIVYPDPPLLIAPGNGELITTTDPFLQWTPLQVPPEFELRYILQMAQLLPGQLPDEALNGAMLHYVDQDVGTTNLQYPLDAPPLEEGKSYAWRVITLDQNGYAAASNGGASETYVFRYDHGSSRSPGQSVITLSMTNAFDTDPDDGTEATSAAAASPRGIDEICSKWDNPVGAFTLSADSPIGFGRFSGNDATLFQVDSTKQWWIKTTSPSGRRDVLIQGGCDRFTDNTLVHWIASRNQTLQQRITDMLSNPVVRVLASGAPLGGVAGINHAMIVLSKGNHEISVPPDFVDGMEFLGDRAHAAADGELEAATGLNVFAALDMNEFALWPLLQMFGFDEKRVDVYGFLGWNAEWSLGASVGSAKPGATDSGATKQLEINTEREFLVLRATLPKRKPVLLPDGWIESSGFEIEISIGDETERAFTDSNTRAMKNATGVQQRLKALAPAEKEESLELAAKLIHRIVVNDELELEGSIELDFTRNRALSTEALTRLKYVTGYVSAMPEVETGTDVVITYAAKTKLPLLPNDIAHIDGATLDLTFPLANPSHNQEFTLFGELGIKNQDGLGKVGVEIKRINLAAMHRDLAAARKARYETSTKLTAAETGACVSGATVSADKTRWCALETKVKSLEKSLAEHNAFPDPSTKETAWEWRVRASIGHMSLGELLKLVREGGS